MNLVTSLFVDIWSAGNGGKRVVPRVIMPSCAVFGCIYHQEAGIHLHKVPKLEPTRTLWLKKCSRRKSFTFTESTVICSRHFTPEDYERNLKYELLRLPIQSRLIRLKTGAVPTLNLPDISEEENSGKRTFKATDYAGMS